jgi:hypothetical protein
MLIVPVRPPSRAQKQYSASTRWFDWPDAPAACPAFSRGLQLVFRQADADFYFGRENLAPDGRNAAPPPRRLSARPRRRGSAGACPAVRGATPAWGECRSLNRFLLAHFVPKHGRPLRLWNVARPLSLTLADDEGPSARMTRRTCPAPMALGFFMPC